MEIFITGTIAIEPERRDALLAAIRPLVRTTRDEEPGCLEYAFTADTVENDRIVVLERWRDEASLTAHFEHPLYVSQLFADEAHPVLPGAAGVVTRIHGTHRTNVDVPFPAGLAVDTHNNVYVSAFSIVPGTGAGIRGLNTSGQVWRLRF